MFAKLKKKIEEETESSLSPPVQLPGQYPDIHGRSIPALSSSSCESTPYKNSTQLKDVNKDLVIKKSFHGKRSSSKEDITVTASRLRKQMSVDTLNKQQFDSQEFREELQDFQKQEISKVKHLLLASENEVKACKERLNEQAKKFNDLQVITNELTTNNDRLNTEAAEKCNIILQLESVIVKLSESNSQMINQIEENKRKFKNLIEIEKCYMKLKTEKDNSSLHESFLAEEKSLLVQEIDDLKKKNLETSSILEEKDNAISDQEERIKVLEKRLNDNSLCDDEKLQSIISERNSLEHKLEESRTNLNEFKTVCSEKIYNLEVQISHLNKKMGEDSEENTKLENEYSKQKIECDILLSELDSLKEKSEKLKNTKTELDEVKARFKQCDSQRLCLKNENEKLNADAVVFGQKVQTLEEQIKKDEVDAKKKIDELMGHQSEQLEKEIANENKISHFEQLLKKLKSDKTACDKECSSLKEKILIIENQLQTYKKEKESLSQNLSERDKVVKENQNMIDSLEIELDSIQQEKDKLLMRNSELSQQSELLKRELNEEISCKEKLQNELLENTSVLQKQTKDMKIQMQSLELSANSSIESSERVSALKSCVVELEGQLVEKNKVIKLQQQRLTDIKKTLQKELKMQHQMGDSNSVGDGLDFSVIGFNKMSKTVPSTPSYNSVNISNSQELMSNDTINIQYLRHVIFKFMTSREYEAQQLIKAVSVLLKFTTEQENIIKETLDWKMSWFGHKPEVKKSVQS